MRQGLGSDGVGGGWETRFVKGKKKKKKCLRW